MEAIDAAGGGWGRRSVRAQPFGWNVDGTPNFGAPVAVGSAIDPPSGTGTADVEARSRLRDQRRAGAL